MYVGIHILGNFVKMFNHPLEMEIVISVRIRYLQFTKTLSPNFAFWSKGAYTLKVTLFFFLCTQRDLSSHEHSRRSPLSSARSPRRQR